MKRKDRIGFCLVCLVLSIPLIVENSLQADSTAHVNSIRTMASADKMTVSMALVGERIDELISRYHDCGLFDGVVLVAVHDQLVITQAYGLANREWSILNTWDTKFRIASITKQFTAMLVMQLVERGQIDLEGKITQYLPWYRKDTGDRISIKMLLTHSSGLPNFSAEQEYWDHICKKSFKPLDFATKYCSSDLQFEPGHAYSYSNSGYYLLGLIVEQITGISYEENLKINIFTPLGMQNSGFERMEQIITKRAVGYDKQYSMSANPPYRDLSTVFAAGGLYSTLDDLFLWDRSMQTEKLISKPFMEELFKRHMDVDENKWYGFGWEITKEYLLGDEYDVISHDGSINGFSTLNLMIPQKGYTVIILCNLWHQDTIVRQICDQIVALLGGQKAEMPIKPVVDDFFSWIERDGINKAIQTLKNLKQSNLVTIKEKDFNGLGYYFLEKNDFESALGVFGLLIDLFPKSANAYDSYGEALLKMGNKADAIISYKKSLELNPDNPGAVTILKELGAW